MACQKKMVSLRACFSNQPGPDGTNKLNMAWNPAQQLPVVKQKNTTATGEQGLGETRPVTGCILMCFKNFELLPRHWVTEHIFDC
jgi:hypothetical protein